MKDAPGTMERARGPRDWLLSRLQEEFSGCHPDVRQLIGILAWYAPATSHSKWVLRDAGIPVSVSTLLSRFFRAQLPPPKTLLTRMRIVLAARLLEDPSLSVVDVAFALNASSPQSFGRTIRKLTGLSPMQFRAAFTGETALARFLSELVDPHRATWATLRPLITESLAQVRIERAAATLAFDEPKRLIPRGPIWEAA